MPLTLPPDSGGSQPDAAAAIAAEHADLRKKSAHLALLFFVEAVGLEGVEDFLDFVEVAGVPELRRVAKNIADSSVLRAR